MILIISSATHQPFCSCLNIYLSKASSVYIQDANLVITLPVDAAVPNSASQAAGTVITTKLVMILTYILYLSVILYHLSAPDDIIQKGRQDLMKAPILWVLILESNPEIIVPNGCFWQGDELGSLCLHPELIYACVWNSTREARDTHRGSAIYRVKARPVLL